MIILGIDPGTTSIGYALLEGKQGTPPRLLNADLISIPAAARYFQLALLEREIKALIQKWRPETMAVEKIFFAKNSKTALAVAEARGVILLTAYTAGLTLYEYTPLEAKKSLTGDGRADKAQVRKMIELTLPQAAIPKGRDDVFDAAALALVCYFKMPKVEILEKIKRKYAS